MEVSRGPSNGPEELTGRIAAGDARALDEVAVQHLPEMVAAASRIVGAEQADDVAQEAWIEAQRALEVGRQPADLGAWLCGIARHQAYDAIGTAARDRVLAELPAHAPPADEAVAHRDRLRRTVAAIRGLPRLQRDALVAQVFEDKSHKQIAAEQGVSSGSVRMAISRARLRLRRGVAVLVPLPVLEALRRAAGRLRDLAGGGVGVGVAAATVAVAVAAATVVDRSPGPQPSDGGDATRADTGAPVASGEGGRGPAVRDDGVLDGRPSSNPQDPAPSAAGPSYPSSPDSPQATPPAPPSPGAQAPPPLPSPPSTPPDIPTPPGGPVPTPPSASPCGSLPGLVPCIIETVEEVIQPGG